MSGGRNPIEDFPEGWRGEATMEETTAFQERLRRQKIREVMAPAVDLAARQAGLNLKPWSARARLRHTVAVGCWTLVYGSHFWLEAIRRARHEASA